LFDEICRLVQIEKRFEALRFLHVMNIAALEVFNQLRLQLSRADISYIRTGFIITTPAK
jgi:hypothetical protein